jgi:hypothetical protein
MYRKYLNFTVISKRCSVAMGNIAATRTEEKESARSFVCPQQIGNLDSASHVIVIKWKKRNAATGGPDEGI